MRDRGCGLAATTASLGIAASATSACLPTVIGRIASPSCLPREESWTSACEMCERSVSVHEGPHAAGGYQFVARGIAGALKAVGAGASYRHAAFVARERAQRMRTDPATGEIRGTRHGSLAMGWVEKFRPRRI